jgi:hypothetical protein
MQLSRDAKIFTGITLLVIPTVQFGGLALLGMLTHGMAGTGGEHSNLNEVQVALFRAGHAHSGVWLVLSLLIQVLLESAKLARPLKLSARLAALLGTAALGGSFFGLAFWPEFRFLLYIGALGMFFAVVVAGIGLLRNLNATAEI